jgi:Flp pilus assembly pilin Flp
MTTLIRRLLADESGTAPIQHAFVAASVFMIVMATWRLATQQIDLGTQDIKADREMRIHLPAFRELAQPGKNSDQD